MEISAKIIEHSTTHHGVEICTLELVYPRFIHGEVMTHRVFSRNAMSSRAVPVAKMMAQVLDDPAMPIHWGANQRGMQASTEIQHVGAAKDLWRAAARNAVTIAEEMVKLGLHKQVANRILEPFQWMRTIVTATEWDNFFALRDHPDADPNFQRLAKVIRTAIAESLPVFREKDVGGNSGNDCWHLPYVSDAERATYPTLTLCKLSAARCARVSYLTHDGKSPVLEDDLDLFDRLVGSTPLHASPIEHQATPFMLAYVRSRNFRGWRQFREGWEGDK